MKCDPMRNLAENNTPRLRPVVCFNPTLKLLATANAHTPVTPVTPCGAVTSISIGAYRTNAGIYRAYGLLRLRRKIGIETQPMPARATPPNFS